MKKIKSRILRKCEKSLTKAALILGKDSVTRSFCIWSYYQPKVPRGMEKFKK